ncbi:alpha/beta-hydrolase [Cristinia sonorae]|uniref:Alpha/beta-hydrolase n=1 Tax=Cristinia sonorae TaxID=1940300 RepID=A0A8K0UCT4_9AGAR|nr:alpha/beta-hydrolase [Cristinia sonorae]
MAEKSFKLAVPDTELDYLRKKLDLVRFPDELEDAGWQYGVPMDAVRRLTARWKEGFDWRAAEAKINELPQFTRDIEVEGFGTLNIHYVHQKTVAKNAIPLLFVHGWPGHFLEVSKLLPLLTSDTGDDPKFHVVALSLPGFGFSEAPKKKAFMMSHYAEVGHKLMLALGYNEYVIQGGDWGYAICHSIAHLYGPKHVKAWHTNMANAGPPTFWASPLLWLRNLLTPFSPADVKGLQQNKIWAADGRGYAAIQQTRPQTIGCFMADSPMGLLAWIYEKLVTWSDNYPWTDDEVLTWVSIYWFSRAGPAASARIYYEFFHKSGSSLAARSTTPFGVSYFPKELVYTPRLWMRTVGNVVFESEHESGGHFAAYEVPEKLANDVKSLCKLESVSKAFK